MYSYMTNEMTIYEEVELSLKTTSELLKLLLHPTQNQDIEILYTEIHVQVIKKRIIKKNNTRRKLYSVSFKTSEL